LSLDILSFKRSFPNIRTIKLIGVRIKKNINAMIIGAIILPSVSPNFIHALFKGFNNFCFKKANAKKISAINKAQNLIGEP